MFTAINVYKKVWAKLLRSLFITWLLLSGLLKSGYVPRLGNILEENGRVLLSRDRS